MTPEEWHAAKDLLADALDLPAGERGAFLDRRCGHDPALRREVEALLTASEETFFLDEGLPALGPAIAEGAALGPYRIERKLAQGAMGEVYQAFDERLERRVAVKVLPARMSDNPSALVRFEREAKALAALSHPNILAIFDVSLQRGTAFAVTELLTGSTLRHRIERGRLPLPTTLDFAIQVARGLAAAHAAGVVHRDLKPENLFVTTAGTIKILDFGIAFTLPPSGKATRDRLTAEHSVIGTARYMSPEQAQGLPCDHRSDLFSLGAVLYEMLAGAPAFPGESVFSLLQAVSEAEPAPLGPLAPAAGPHLLRLVQRCLEKEPERRFQSASDLAFYLETLADAPAPEPVGGTEDEAPGRPRKPWLAAALGAAVAAVAGLALWAALRSAPPAPPRLDSLTHETGDSAPAASPDGGTVAFVSQRGGRSRIWLKQVGSGDERPFTDGSDGVDSAPRFSPDGQTVLFTRDGDGGPALYRAGLLGGEAQLVVRPARQGAWSPDGRRIAFVREQRAEPRNGWSIGVVAVDGSRERVFPAEGMPLAHLVWSPDGRSVWAVRRRSAVGLQDDLLRVEVESGKATAFAPPQAGGQISRPAWAAGGRTLLLALTGSVTGYLPSSQVLAFAPEGGRFRTLFWYPNGIETLEALGNDRLLFDSIDASQSLGETGEKGAASPASGAGAGASWRWLTQGDSIDRQPCYTPDGRSLAFSSNRSGNIDLWLLSLATGSLKRLTEDPADDWDPAFTPDGRLLVWSSNRGGKFEIYVAEADGRNPRPLTKGNRVAENPTVTGDGRWVVYSSERLQAPTKKEGAGLRRVRLDGTQDQAITDVARGHPDVSPDGRFVVVRSAAINGVTELRVVAVEGGAVLPEAVRLQAAGVPAGYPVTLGRPRWLPGGREVAFLAPTANGQVGLLARAFDPQRGLVPPSRVLLEGSPERIPESFNFARDGRLAVSFVHRRSNLMTASGLDLRTLRP